MSRLFQALLLTTEIPKRFVLPRHSVPGQYLVAITRDQNGNSVVAEGLTTTAEDGHRQEITANLDLRSAKAERYFLSTTLEQDQAAYYCPLEIEAVIPSESGNQCSSDSHSFVAFQRLL